MGPAPLPHRIVLTGFMGAGKSTVGRLLAARLHWPFFDIDTLITTRQRLSVAEIFAQHGEAYFRQLETEAITAALNPTAHNTEQPMQKRAVLALGGGALETEAVRELLFLRPPSVPIAVTIYLEAPLNEMLARCQGGGDTPIRPLLAAPELPENRLARRLPHYRRAHLTVDTSGVPPGAVVDRILAWLSESRLAAASTDTRQASPASTELQDDRPA